MGNLFQSGGFRSRYSQQLLIASRILLMISFLIGETGSFAKRDAAI